MEDLLKSIESCLVNKEYYGALVITLLIPSIAGASESHNNRDNEQSYKAWFNTWVRDFPNFKGVDCYKYRCKLIHQGLSMPDRRSKDSNSVYTKVIFNIPNSHFKANGNRYISNKSNSHVIDLDLELFCRAVIKGARNWLVSIVNNDEVLNRLNLTVKTRPHPAFGGMGLISIY